LSRKNFNDKRQPYGKHATSSKGDDTSARQAQDTAVGQACLRAAKIR